MSGVFYSGQQQYAQMLLLSVNLKDIHLILSELLGLQGNLKRTNPGEVGQKATPENKQFSYHINSFQLIFIRNKISCFYVVF